MARPKNYLPTWSEWAESLYTPAILMLFSIRYLIETILITTFVKFRPQDLLHFKKIKDAAFSRFWLVVSALPDPPPRPEELVGSSALIPPLLQQAEGDVLELGPGSGTQLAYINSKKIRSYHAAEPSEGLHDSLSQHAKQAGLTPGKNFHIHPCGGETESLLPVLARAGLVPKEIGASSGADRSVTDSPSMQTRSRGKQSSTNKDASQSGSFDTIICVRVLCSVPNPEATVKTLYSLLRPGGKLIVVEHIVNPAGNGPWGSRLAKVLQLLYTALGWRFFIGGCELLRDTEASLRDAGLWKLDKGVEGLVLSGWWGSLPYISGILTKA